jgi:hypothetical protein
MTEAGRNKGSVFGKKTPKLCAIFTKNPYAIYLSPPYI